jgi:hypothetical protein
MDHQLMERFARTNDEIDRFVQAKVGKEKEGNRFSI